VVDPLHRGGFFSGHTIEKFAFDLFKSLSWRVLMKEILTVMVEQWIEEKPMRTVPLLAKISGVGETTIRRAVGGSNTPALDTIVSLGRATGKRSLMLEAVLKYYPTCFEVIEKSGMGADKQPEADTSEFLEASVSTTLFLSLYTRTGLSKKSVKAQHGTKGLAILDRMIGIGVAIAKDEDHVVARENWYSYHTPEEVLRTIRNLTLDFDKSSIGSDFARMTVLSESVNSETAKRIQSIVDRAVVDIRALMNDPNSIGTDVVAVSLLMQPVK
jgi:hypothetical protein